MSKVYNVQASVVALVRADNEDAALDLVHASLTRNGFEAYPCGTDGAFESEDLATEPDPLP